MASMATTGVIKVPRYSSSSSSNVRNKAIHRSLSFSSSELSGDKIVTVSSGAGRGRCIPKHVIVTPKAVSDSQNSQTCLDPDASRVSLSLLLLFVFLPFLELRAQ